MSEDLRERELRSVLGRFASGIIVAAAIDDGEPVGMTIQSFCSLSLAPPLILVCPSMSSATWPRIAAGGTVCVNLLSEEQHPLAAQFARKGAARFDGVAWKPAPSTGSPVLDDALGWIDCEISSSHPAGDHHIVVCRVVDLGAASAARPLIYFRSAYHRISG